MVNHRLPPINHQNTVHELIGFERETRDVRKMEKILDSTQLVSGVAILLSFLAGYRYGLRNLDADLKEQEGAAGGVNINAEKPRVSSQSFTSIG